MGLCRSSQFFQSRGQRPLGQEGLGPQQRGTIQVQAHGSPEIGDVAHSELKFQIFNAVKNNYYILSEVAMPLHSQDQKVKRNLYLFAFNFLLTNNCQTLHQGDRYASWLQWWDTFGPKSLAGWGPMFFCHDIVKVANEIAIKIWLYYTTRQCWTCAKTPVFRYTHAMPPLFQKQLKSQQYNLVEEPNTCLSVSVTAHFFP